MLQLLLLRLLVASADAGLLLFGGCCAAPRTRRHVVARQHLHGTRCWCLRIASHHRQKQTTPRRRSRGNPETAAAPERGRVRCERPFGARRVAGRSTAGWRPGRPFCLSSGTQTRQLHYRFQRSYFTVRASIFGDRLLVLRRSSGRFSYQAIMDCGVARRLGR